MFRNLTHSPISWESIVPTPRREAALEGALLGCAVAEAIGTWSTFGARGSLLQPGKPPNRAWPYMKLFPGHRTHGMILTLQAVLLSSASIDRFGSMFRRRWRWYRISRPLQGWMPRIAGGPFASTRTEDPMVRAAILGVVMQGHSAAGHRWIHRSTTLTHRDALVAQTAMLVAIASQVALLAETPMSVPVESIWTLLQEVSQPAELKERLAALGTLDRDQQPLAKAAECLGYGHGLRGNMVDDSLLALYAWCRHNQDYAACIQSIVNLRGDIGGAIAIAGALMGTQHGVTAIPEAWRDAVTLFPNGASWIEDYVERVRDWPHGPEDIRRPYPLPTFPFGQLGRNLRSAIWRTLMRVG